MRGPDEDLSARAGYAVDLLHNLQYIIEMLQDVQTSIGQIEGGQGVDHETAKASVLKRIRK